MDFVKPYIISIVRNLGTLLLFRSITVSQMNRQMGKYIKIEKS
jgi:hypothetical protein